MSKFPTDETPDPNNSLVVEISHDLFILIIAVRVSVSIIIMIMAMMLIFFSSFYILFFWREVVCNDADHDDKEVILQNSSL